MTAKQVFGVQDVTKELRSRAKAINFGIVYGMEKSSVVKIFLLCGLIIGFSGTVFVKEYIKTIGLYNNKAKNIMALCQKMFDDKIQDAPNDFEYLTEITWNASNQW